MKRRKKFIMEVRTGKMHILGTSFTFWNIRNLPFPFRNFQSFRPSPDCAKVSMNLSVHPRLRNKNYLNRLWLKVKESFLFTNMAFDISKLSFWFSVCGHFLVLWKVFAQVFNYMPKNAFYYHRYKNDKFNLYCFLFDLGKI